MDIEFTIVAFLFITIVLPICLMMYLLLMYFNKYVKKNYLCRKCHSVGVDTYITKDEHDTHNGNCKKH